MQNLSVRDVLRRLMDCAAIEGKPLSGRRLAKLSGADQPTIHRILSGKVQQPRNESLIPVARFFGITLGQLRGYDPLPDELPAASLCAGAERSGSASGSRGVGLGPVPPAEETQEVAGDALSQLIELNRQMLDCLRRIERRVAAMERGQRSEAPERS